MNHGGITGVKVASWIVLAVFALCLVRDAIDPVGGPCSSELFRQYTGHWCDGYLLRH